MSLKAGSVDDFAGSLAAAMEQEMQNEWFRVKGEYLPVGIGEEDRKIFFVGIARGLLQYLQLHNSDLLTNTVSDTNNGHKHHLVI